MKIIFAGDPHGRHHPIISACLRQPEPGMLILLGDLDLDASLRSVYRALLDAGWQLRYIIGNHDTDRASMWHHLVDDAPGWNIGGSFTAAGHLIIGGLGGIFKGRVWWPQDDANAPATYESAEQLFKATPRTDRWFGGLPLGMRDTIFPAEMQKLAAYRLDILVSHEAPLPHRYGFAALNALADRTGAKLIIHGHHHHSEAYQFQTPSGRTVEVRGLAQSETFLFDTEAMTLGWPRQMATM